MRMTSAEKLILMNQRMIMLALMEMKESPRYHHTLSHQMLETDRAIEAAKTWMDE